MRPVLEILAVSRIIATEASASSRPATKSAPANCAPRRSEPDWTVAAATTPSTTSIPVSSGVARLRGNGSTSFRRTRSGATRRVASKGAKLNSSATPRPSPRPRKIAPNCTRSGESPGSKLRKADDDSEWTRDEITLMENLTRQLGLTLESAQHYRDTQRRALREQMTTEITARIRETLDIDTVLQTAIREIGDKLNIARVQVRMKGQERE